MSQKGRRSGPYTELRLSRSVSPRALCSKPSGERQLSHPQLDSSTDTEMVTNVIQYLNHNPNNITAPIPDTPLPVGVPVGAPYNIPPAPSAPPPLPWPMPLPFGGSISGTPSVVSVNLSASTNSPDHVFERDTLMSYNQQQSECIHPSSNDYFNRNSFVEAVRNQMGPASVAQGNGAKILKCQCCDSGFASVQSPPLKRVQTAQVRPVRTCEPNRGNRP